MANLNEVRLLGRLGKDPEYKAFANGGGTTHFTLATTTFWKDKETGEKKEATEWHRIVAFGRVAEIARDHLKSGSQAFISGALRTRKWQEKEGGEDRYVTEIVADSIQMLDSKNQNSSESS